jgi:hypothetical protein
MQTLALPLAGVSRKRLRATFAAFDAKAGQLNFKPLDTDGPSGVNRVQARRFRHAESIAGRIENAQGLRPGSAVELPVPFGTGERGQGRVLDSFAR